jgi:CHAT domain
VTGRRRCRVCPALADGHDRSPARTGVAPFSPPFAPRPPLWLFSSVSLDDGPLTVDDLSRLRRPPLRLVLSSCESGVASPVGADELLGMASALMPLGTASILASVVPVNDAATAPLMVAFHERLRAGLSFGEALLAIRTAVGRDPTATATASYFGALGR